MKLRFHSEAAEEARAAAIYYESARPGLGDAFLKALAASLDRIAENPGTHPFEKQAAPCRNRRVQRFPYRVVYRETEAVVDIVAVVHDRREPGYWQGRLRSK